MPGITSLLDIGKKSLFASQAAIQVTGNNVSNANTPGYSRQAVRFEDGNYINYSPGQLGSGVVAAEVIRHFDEFVEVQYNAKTSEEQRWGTLYESLKSVEGILNESNSKGLNSALSEFWADWQKLSTDPQNISVKSALLGHAANLESIIQSTGQDLRRLQSATDEFIDQDVTKINEILSSIAKINTQITTNEVPGKNNVNSLRDERAMLVRQLAAKMDINYIDNGLGNITITTKAGHTLVDGQHAFHLAFENPQAGKNLIQRPSGTATFAGSVHFEGTSSHEYTLEVLTSGSVATTVPAPVGTATFRASIDGGKTWLKDDAGNERHFYASDLNNKVTLPAGGPTVYFDQAAGDPGRLLAGDVFNITPKKGLYWYENSSSKMNITPQVFPNGEDDTRRLIGGTMTGYFHFRDQSIGGYLEKLDAFAASMAWETNRIHSQGAGASRFVEVTGTYKVSNTTAALGGLSSGLEFGEKMTNGNVMVHIYNKTTGALESSQALDFDAAAGVQNFDPKAHSLQDVQQAFQRIGLTADIRDGHLHLQAASGRTFAFGADSSGMLAALGLNTFFAGSDARTLSLNTEIISNVDRINAGHVNGAGEINSGDNTTAKALAALQTTKVSITTIADGTTSQTLGEYYSALVSKAGADTANAKFTTDYHAALAKDLRSRQEAVSGVNLDEEITNLIKFQHSYTAAAKLITTAESMLQVLLGLKS